MSWLHAAPGAPGKFKEPPKEVSRLEAIIKRGGEVKLPEASLSYLIEYLFDAGPSMPSGLGEAPLSHGEIRAWQDNTGIRLTPFEVRTIRRASREYVSGRAKAADPNMPAPWTPDEEASSEELVAVGASLRDSIRAMAKRGPK